MSEIGEYSATLRGNDVFVNALRYCYRMYSWETYSSCKHIEQMPQALVLLVAVGEGHYLQSVKIREELETSRKLLINVA